MAKLLSFLYDKSNIVKWFFFALLIFIIVFDYFAERHAAHFFGDNIIGFWTIFGVFICLAMIIICKGLSHVWLMKGEDYYDN
ncbi:MAG: hypothetical protein HQK79_13035 [Desulfobacterales bacterium]|nr:hypothetical protein [Desulfobacterales bacterium]MBF0397934.1 hypothetical protein [Desulfobacterales bacterium]